MSSASRSYQVVVGFDYTDVSRRALRWALRLASEKQDVVVHVLHVQPTITTYTHGVVNSVEFSPGALAARALDRLERVVQRELEAFRRRTSASANPVPAVVSHLRMTDPAREIVQLADQLDAGLTIVGTHGRTGLSRLLLGSVAHAVISRSHRPVLVVPDDDRDAEEKQAPIGQQASA